MKTFIYLILAMLPLSGFAQKDNYPLDWFLRNVEQDSMYGAGVQRIYEEFLVGKQASPLIVAVIDVAFDTAAQMLHPALWKNLKEIPGNGKDDDNNGYVDDIHGWNFLGTKDGKSLQNGVNEGLRMYSHLWELYKGNMKKMSPEERNLYVALYKTYGIKKLEHDKESINAKEKLKTIRHTKRQRWFKDAYRKYLVRQQNEMRQNDGKPKNFFNSASHPKDTVATILAEETSLRIKIKNQKEYLTLASSIRKAIGDNPYDINDTKYGHANFPLSMNSRHGTHVASTIAGAPEPKSGIYGIAQGAQIMLLQVVPPGGDEEDKDIALAIRYAVDNGAKIINMSFGKYAALDKTQKWIEEAMDYAAAHDVLLIRAAGNSCENLDKVNVYPLRPTNPQTESCYICVGAHGSNLRAEDKNNKLVSFSNYGKHTVDLFAPGHMIYSQLPYGQYGQLSGTSMASPVCAGVAALIRMYYPELSASQVKEILMRTVTPCDQTCNFFVKERNKFEKIKFNELSISGGMLNGYEAFKLAGEIASPK